MKIYNNSIATTSEAGRCSVTRTVSLATSDSVSGADFMSEMDSLASGDSAFEILAKLFSQIKILGLIISK